MASPRQVKHNMALEAWNSMYNAVLMFALVGAMASIGVLVRSAQQYGKAAVLQAVLLERWGERWGERWRGDGGRDGGVLE